MLLDIVLQDQLFSKCASPYSVLSFKLCTEVSGRPESADVLLSPLKKELKNRFREDNRPKKDFNIYENSKTLFSTSDRKKSSLKKNCATTMIIAND